jgi:hypothetical protein
MKNQFCDSGFEVLEKSGVTSVVWCDEIATLKLTVVDPADERVVEVNVVRITYDVDLEVVHNLPVIAKTYYSSAIRSLQDSSNMKKVPFECASPNSLVQCHHEGLNGNKDSVTRKKPPHWFYPIIPCGAFNTHTRGLV